MGSGIALQIAIRHPDLVRKARGRRASYNNDGLYPEVLKGNENMKPEDLAESRGKGLRQDRAESGTLAHADRQSAATGSGV